MKKTVLFFILLLISGLSLPASAAITALLDKNQVGIGESVQLTLQHDGQTDSQPDLTPLKQDFNVLGRSTGSTIQFINGKMSSQVQVSLAIAPKHSGKLIVPALQWDGQFSPVLALTVSSNSATGQTANQSNGNATHEFVTTALDQKQPYVQAAVTLTVRLYTDEPLIEASLDIQPNNDVQIQQLGKDRQTSETRNGRNYQVIERKYLLFPQRSGRITLDGPVLNAQVKDTRNTDSISQDPFFNNFLGHNPLAGMFNATRPLRLQGEQIVLNVLPRPAGNTGKNWLPAQNVTLEETWQPDNGLVHAGEPITRHLHLVAKGLTANQLPDMSSLMNLPANLRAYPDQPSLNTEVQGEGVIGTRDQDIALIANQPGKFVIPATHLFWWDTNKNIQREIVLPIHTLDVLPSTTAVSTSSTPSSSQVAPASRPPVKNDSLTPAKQKYTENAYWPWISLGLIVLWIATIFAWWRTSRSRHPKMPTGLIQNAAIPASKSSADNAHKAFQQACLKNDPQSARRHLQDWAKNTWPNDPPIGLKAISERLGISNLKPLLNQLDRACYAGEKWEGKALKEALKSIPVTTKKGIKSTPELSELYP
ncbi:BatD family protein [Sulfurirhabdus autotrophica]|uniref:Oxygen tolerance protein BatD n=1 Tax=Sulfurirhabdus autotrophica TaxID=1706046 RepID=A0A4R3YC02_9PROT|nr:BatD family protein [Sulfurirhabdus autotrophica]TCV89500.1 oxygen tolerance protein BatD [Sulfurirhabdus autotrophica]